MKTEEIKKRLDALCEKRPSRTIPSIHEYEDKHLLMVSRGPRGYGRFIEQFGLFYDLINEIIIGVNYIDKTKWPKYRGLQLLLLIHNLRSLYSAFDRLIKGHWEDTLIIGRTNLESFIKIIWISCYPDRADSAILDLKDRGRKFNFTNFVNDELKLTWNDYKTMSDIIHGNKPAVIKDMIAIHKKTKKYPIVLELKFDRKYFEVGVNYIVFLSLSYLMVTNRLFATSSNEYLKKETIEDACELERLWKETLLSHPRGHWPKVVKDVDDMLQMVEKTEKEGGDWKDIWELIRKGGRRNSII